MPNVDQAQRCIRDSYAILDELTKYVSMAANDYSVQVAGSDVHVQLPPQKVQEIQTKATQLVAQLKGLVASINIPA